MKTFLNSKGYLLDFTADQNMLMYDVIVTSIHFEVSKIFYQHRALIAPTLIALWFGLKKSLPAFFASPWQSVQYWNECCHVTSHRGTRVSKTRRPMLGFDL